MLSGTILAHLARLCIKMMIMEYEVKHLPAEHRFVVEIDGNLAHVDYVIENGALDIRHTIVPKPLEGQGIASALVGAAYAYAYAHSLSRKATCPYAVVWLQRHRV